jgi:hypothetical protein
LLKLQQNRQKGIKKPFHHFDGTGSAFAKATVRQAREECQRKTKITKNTNYK